ncbi:MAG: alginate lyase family protein [Prevotella sp.]|nr:alginate lyase family protein [Prevotella sp.]
MSRFLGVLFFLVALCKVSAKDKPCQQLMIWDLEYLQSWKKDTRPDTWKQTIIKEAELAVKGKAESVVDKESSLFVSNKHYYVSTAPYWWPDTLKDGTIKYIRKDGVRNPNRLGQDHERWSRLNQALKNLSRAYFFTGDTKFRDAYVSRLRRWFVTKSTRMYPNFDFSSIVPGQGGNKGRQYGIVELYAMNDILDSYRLMCQLNGVDKKTTNAFEKWCRNLMTWLRQSENGKAESLATGNISTIYDLTLFNLAVFCGEKVICDSITSAFATSRLERQIMADGTQPVELARTQAYHYSIYNLTHIVDFCVLQERLGRHYYAEHRNIIDRAFNYLLQFVGNRKAFPYQEIGDWDACEKLLKKQQARLKTLK